MKYRMQIFDPVAREWKFVRPSSSKDPYQYDTHAKAYRMLNMCYPDASWGTQKRISDEFGAEVVGGALLRNLDATRFELLKWCSRWLARHWSSFDRNEKRFCIEEVIYWYANMWHGGQYSNLYQVLSQSPYKPSPLHSGIADSDCEIAREMYLALEIEHTALDKRLHPEQHAVA